MVPLLWSTVACSRNQPLAPSRTDGMSFDFLHGRWRVRNRRLVARLQASTEWQEFDAELEGQRLMGGIANLDCLHIPVFTDGKPLDVLDLKVFDPAAQTWTLIQADSRTGQLGKPLVGRFSAGRGVSRWSDITATSVRWEQAFSPDRGATWETNWQAVMTREA